MDEFITIRGAREHNLKNIDIDIPRDRFVVITGLSGSGKSSLAFDTVYAEGQRRYMETMSSYARQFLGVMERPDVDFIEGLSPAISIEQKRVTHNPRSTVGTVTEIYDYLRLLFARVGTQYCYSCEGRVKKQTIDQIIETISEDYRDTRVEILAPVVKGRKGHYKELFEKIRKEGFLRVRVDGKVTELKPGLSLNRYKVHDIEILVDRLEPTGKVRSRLADSVETAIEYGDGEFILFDGKKDRIFSKHFSCDTCRIGYTESAPHSFSFNSPYGWCPECEGLGETRDFERALLIPDDTKSITDGGILPLGKERGTALYNQVIAVAKQKGINLEGPIKSIPRKKL